MHVSDLELFDDVEFFFSFRNYIKKRISSEVRMKLFLNLKKKSFKLQVEIFLY